MLSSNISNLCIEKCTLAFYVYLAHYSKEAVSSHNPGLTTGQHFMGIVVKVAQLITINAWGEKFVSCESVDIYHQHNGCHAGAK